MINDIGTQIINHRNSLIDKKKERWIFNIERGKFPLTSITNVELRNDIEDRMIDKYKSGELTRQAAVRLIEYQLIMINIGIRLIDDISDILKSEVNHALACGAKVTNLGIINYTEDMIEYEPK